MTNILHPIFYSCIFYIVFTSVPLKKQYRKKDVRNCFGWRIICAKQTKDP